MHRPCMQAVLTLFGSSGLRNGWCGVGSNTRGRVYIVSIVIIANALLGEKNPKLMDASTGMGRGVMNYGSKGR